MKTIVKLAIAALILNAGFRGGMSYYDRHDFERDVHMETLSGSFDTSDRLVQHILEMATVRGHVMTPDDIHVTMEEDWFVVDMKWIDLVELVPRVYMREFPYEGRVQVRRVKPEKLIP